MDGVNFSSVITWESLKNAEDIEDYQITFLLYQEGKNIDLISKIRNLSKEVVQDHILQSKIKLKNKVNKDKKDHDKVSYHPSFVALLAADKTKRIQQLEVLNSKEREGLTAYLKKVLSTIDNAEDKMIALWIAGQLKDERLLPIIAGEIEHKHGGVRRMVCSALRKIPHSSTIDILHRGLQDTKPQVRQYAAKALGDIGDEKTIKRLRNILNNPKELDYVKRTYHQTIETIEKRIKEITN